MGLLGLPRARAVNWFIPTRTGTFDIRCFELCGVGHYLIRGNVVVEEESTFQAWLQEQSTFAELMAEAGAGEAGGPELRLTESEAGATESAVTQ